MTVFLPRLPAFLRSRAELPDSTQICRWPPRLARLDRTALLVSLALVVSGVGVLAWWPAPRTQETLVGGVLLEVLGSMGLVASGLLRMTVASEVRFTRDAIVVRRPPQRDLVLPYAAYDIEWMAHMTDAGNARLIAFEPHQGCTVLRPPDWFATAISEIARIQEEEGWYEPRSDRPASRAEPFASSQS